MGSGIWYLSTIDHKPLDGALLQRHDRGDNIEVDRRCSVADESTHSWDTKKYYEMINPVLPSIYWIIGYFVLFCSKSCFRC